MEYNSSRPQMGFYESVEAGDIAPGSGRFFPVGLEESLHLHIHNLEFADNGTVPVADLFRFRSLNKIFSQDILTVVSCQETVTSSPAQSSAGATATLDNCKSTGTKLSAAS